MIGLSIQFLILITAPRTSGYWENRIGLYDSSYSHRPEFQLRLEDTKELWASEMRYRHDFSEEFGVEEDFDIRELYLNFSISDQHRLRLGQQTLIWGVFDEFSANDYINPEDYSYYLTDERGDRKIGTPALEWLSSFGGGEQQVTFVYLPWFQSHRLPPARSPWRSSALPANYTKNEPDLHWKNQQFGIRYLFSSIGGDLALYAFHGFDPLPAIELSPLPETHHERFTAGGFALAVPIEDQLVKAEVSIRSSSAQETSSGELFKSSEFRSNLGWESFSLSPVWFELDFFFSTYLKREQTSLREAWAGILLFQIRRSWLQEDLEAELRYAFDTKNPSHFFNSEVNYRFLPAFKAALGTYLFAGEFAGIFGQYRENDQVYVEARYSF